MTNYDAYSTVGAAAGGFVGAMLVFVIIIVIICLILGILQIVGTWKILNKANKPGWGAIIPFYNQYLLCQVVGISPWWVLIVVLSSILAAIPVIGSLLVFAISIYFTVLLNVSLARSFGKEDSYAVGLILLAPIFYFILGIKDDKYLGSKPMNDIVFEKLNINTNSANNTSNNTNNQSNNTEQNANVKYCPGCGTQITTDTKYCPSCGKEL